MRGICLSAVAMLGLLYGTADASRTERPLPLTQHFHSRPDLKPPGIHLAKRASGVSAGYIFIAPKLRVAQPGPEILDDNGQVVWFQPLAAKDVSDFRVQTYEGKPVLTWWRGRAPGGVGGGYYVMYDTTYHKIAQVKAGHGLIGDLHEFRITPRNTALITVYKRRPADLRPVGGPRAGKILWRLGGRRTDFRLGPGVGFAWQHDARRLPDGTISLFDNSATPP
ncbi:MAG: arylsulfotransferase family protein, partial [Gaiellaceae bacterium]